MICGGANVLQKEDEAIHVICAIISFICFLIWILLINYLCIVPVIICLIAGKDKLKWRIEIGLIISVYLVLLLSLY
jgi:membrane protein YqaA with SNARE-associated domain